MLERSWELAKRLAAAVALGVGSVFGHKADPTEHWSSTPKPQLLAEADDDDSGDPRTGGS
ncbi:MAG: hypothetical protein GY812_06920 [Actinomycetia bacterium]|nr:hypothetical protein [Actinomycetes bacterium]